MEKNIGDKRNGLCVIFASYREEMKDLIKKCDVESAVIKSEEDTKTRKIGFGN